MEVAFWLVIFFIWVISNLLKEKKTQPTQRPKWEWPPLKSPPAPEQEETEEEWGILEPEIQSPTVPEKLVVAEKPVMIGPKEVKEAPVPQPKVIAQEEKEPAFVFSADKLQEGIILSVILGPPKAKNLLPKWWNGIHVGLKNR